MTHHEIKTLPDGTRLYSNKTKYRPKTAEERKYKVRKPDDPRARMYNREWFFPLELLDEGDRVMPEATRADTEAYDHMSKPRRCKCDVCRRPEAKRWKLLWRREKRAQMRSASDSTMS